MKLAIAVRADADAILQLVNAAYRGSTGGGGWTDETRLLSGPRISAPDVAALIDDVATTIIVARPDEGVGLAGCIAIKAGIDCCTLSMLAVDPVLQSSGTGRAILEGTERFAAGRGIRVATMTVIQQRETLIAWYERRGYSRTGEIEPFPYGDDSVGTPLRDDLQFVVLAKQLAVTPS